MNQTQLVQKRKQLLWLYALVQQHLQQSPQLTPIQKRQEQARAKEFIKRYYLHLLLATVDA